MLISNCGFPGADNFSGLLETFKIMPRDGLNAAILCSQGGALRNYDLQERLQPYFVAVQRAGREVVERGYIETETQRLLEQEFLNPQEYRHVANAGWQTAMAGNRDKEVKMWKIMNFIIPLIQCIVVSAALCYWYSPIFPPDGIGIDVKSEEIGHSTSQSHNKPY